MSGHSEEPTPEQVAADLTQVVGRLVRKLRSASPMNGLSPSQRSVLARLDRGGPTTTAELARAEFVRPQSMRMTVSALESMALIERAPDPDDGRQSVLSLTDQGRRTLTEGRAAKRGWLSEAVSAELDPAELRQLADAVVLLERLVQK
ncbi:MULTISPECIES: MarR family winged helix-turn-helix transcriptional regulator [Streptomyces]|uniref:MarR family transcriptional regulator n=1 Tax=Streptomyces venezuelae TaxID=54571 RepID=A0A5P2B5U4_STRVZ|nr:MULTISPECIES: MarR family transcriptional regulator [Streptomyces]NEA01585.1 MarR family transcriptional regulator [Streptomyces sp. SID10116]MYY85235.1 MarR family transcriptional regulator [Streptomyces sp. SID335]NDZ91162.1 MarR family transcriptional regulator [Streptomyces sp. SID10115]NEB47753.1 MarR family transcriptional regulator [Streptomyces sp. SID339]QES25290.1 MarR family transcriptional regulator [Streptomyces venezuelae]